MLVRVQSWAPLLGALFLLGCSGSLRDLPVDVHQRCLRCDDQACAAPLDLTFLGAGGFILQRGEDTVVIDPFFSNPSVARFLFGRARSDDETVLRWMPNLPNASALLVGHAHYDHLLDVPTVARERTPSARIYASATAKNILTAAGLADRTTAVAGWKKGPWKPEKINDRVQFLALHSEHAPHFLGMTFMEGEYGTPLTKPPWFYWRWLEGETLAFAIDFLAADGSTDFRVLFHDSAAEPNLGMPPTDLPPARVRVAIPCVASFAQVDRYPGHMLYGFAPHYLVLGHWEDFFTPYSQSVDEVRSVRGTDVGGFLEKLSGYTRENVAMPLPGVTTRITGDCASAPP